MYQNNILIFDDSSLVLQALEQYATLVLEGSVYQLIGHCKYGEVALVSLYQKADIVLFGLFRRYGTRLRAEGVPSIANRIKFGGKGLIFGFGIPDMAENPLFWDIASRYTLLEKLSGLNQLSDSQTSLQPLQEFFQRDIFAVDRHW